MVWDGGALLGPDGEDWLVPVSELQHRQSRFRDALLESGIESAWISDPVDLYWLCGNRQAGAAWLPATDLTGAAPVQFVRSSLDRARHEAGADAAVHSVEAMPRMAALADDLRLRGASRAPALQRARLPAADADFLAGRLASMGTPSAGPEDCSRILWSLRETKSEWELARMRESGIVQRRMFEAVREHGDDRAGSGESFTELDLAAAAERVSRAHGFGGHIRLRRWPMDCDRAVVASGPSGAVPSFFDSAIGAAGPHPLAALGAGHRRIEPGEPVIVDIVHVHRGYVSDMTRMFSLGPPDTAWLERQADMIEIAHIVRDSLGRGDDCSAAWQSGVEAAAEMGHADHLMGMRPDQARFLGHGIGLELDETPVVATGFDRPLPIGGAMAIEPKVIHPDGAVGIEDSWVRTADSMQRLSGGSDGAAGTGDEDAFADWTEW